MRPSRFCVTARLALLAVVAVLAIPLPAGAADRNAPFIPAGQEGLYRFDFGRIYSSTTERIATRDSLEASLARIEASMGRITRSARDLLDHLRQYDRMTLLLRRELVYLRLRYSVDRTRTGSLDSLNHLVALVNDRLAFVGDELRSLDDSTLTRFERELPALAPYRFSLRGGERLAGARLSVGERRLLARLEPLATRWVAEHYNALDRPTGGVGFAGSEAEVAFGLRHLTRAGNELARINGYQNAAEEAYAEDFLRLADVESLTTRLTRVADLNRRYERTRIAQLQRLTGRDTLDYYADYLQNPPGTQDPRFRVDQAAGIVANALGPLGADYQQELRRLLDPRNGRLDIVPGPNRVPGGFASGFPGAVTSTFYMQAYDGTFWNLMVLAHEAGHAVQFELMGRAGVLPRYANGPEYLTESYAQFNELLLIDWLRRTASARSLQAFYSEQFLQRTIHELFAQARAVAFENAMYESSAAGRSLTADALNRLMRELGAKYSSWFGSEDESMRDWVQIPHYSRNPFYRVHYLYGRLLALRYYELYRRDARAFVPRYLRLMAGGYPAEPEKLLRHALGIEFSAESLVGSSLRLLEEELERYRALVGPPGAGE